MSAQGFTPSDRILQALLLRVRPAALADLLKTALRVRRKIVEVEAGRFVVDPVSNFAEALLRSGEYEPAMVRLLRRFLGPGGVFVDLGANEGYFSVIAARLVEPGGRVVAVEPQRRLRPVVERNCELNAVRNVELWPCAISDRQERAVLHLSPGTNPGSTGLFRATRYRVATDVVDAMTLGDLFAAAGLDRVDLLKVDIEGGEYEAILGAPEVFRDRRVRVLVLELHPAILGRRGRDPGDIVRLLEASGYRIERDADSLVCTVA